MLESELEKNGGCPVPHGTPRGTHLDAGMMTNQDWWPNILNLKVLHQNSAPSDPMGASVQLRGGVQEARLGRASATICSR